MGYRCQVCGKEAKTAKGMAEHLASTTYLYEKHIDWVQANGLRFAKLTGAGSYGPLLELVEQKCKSD
ncbi:MAG: hypothetical protein FJZ95_10355 [Chloroflexi bacterium]|nr:hypothetical protein [Chloroflexota bacterium]